MPRLGSGTWDYAWVAVLARPSDASIGDETWAQVGLAEAAALSGDAVLARLGVSQAGLGAGEAARRLAIGGPNTVRTHRLRWWVVLARQLRSALLLLLVVTATVSFFVGDRPTR